MISYWVIFLLVDITAMVSKAVTEPPSCFSNINKLWTFSAGNLIDSVGGPATDWLIDGVDGHFQLWLFIPRLDE